MATNPLAAWFEYLLAIHDHTLNISNLADPDVKVFSKQKPDTVLPTLALQEDLSFFLDTNFLQRVPQQAYTTATFVTFLEALAGNRNRIMRAMFFSLAVKHNPALAASSLAAFGAMVPATVVATPAAQDELFDRIDVSAPTSFFPTTAANRTRFKNLLATAATVDDAVKDTLA